MVDKSVCNCKKKKKSLWKGNSGFEKEKFVLLSQKKMKEKEMKKNKKKEVWKKSSNKTRSTNNENWDEFVGGLCFLKENLWKSDYDEMFHLSQDIWIPLSYSFN